MIDKTLPMNNTRMRILIHIQAVEPPHNSGAAISKSTLINAGRLYPELDVLERAGWVQGTWETLAPDEPERPRRRFYSIAPDAERLVTSEFVKPARSWGFGKVLKYKPALAAAWLIGRSV